MKFARKSAGLLVAGALLSATATGAFAQAPPPAFNWGGLHVGLGTSYAWFNFPSDELHLNAYAGLNFVIGSRAVAGVRGYITFWHGFGFGGPVFNEWRGGVEGRAGMLVSPTIWAFGALGVAKYLGPGGNLYLTVGPGVEFAVGDVVTLGLAYNYERGLSMFAATGGHRITGTVNFYLGNY